MFVPESWVNFYGYFQYYVYVLVQQYGPKTRNNPVCKKLPVQLQYSKAHVG